MKFDVNKIITESLNDINETLVGSYEAAKRSSQATLDMLKGGSAEDEAKAAAEYAASAIEKAKSENPGILDKLGKESENVTEKIKGTGKKVLDSVKENPKMSAAVATALAAGLGALALRKRLKTLKK